MWFVGEFRLRGSVGGAQHRTRSSRSTSRVQANVIRAISRNNRLSIRRLAINNGAPDPQSTAYCGSSLGSSHINCNSPNVCTGVWTEPSERSFVGGCWVRFRLHLLVSYVAHFYLNGQVSKQNGRVIWAETPQATAWSKTNIQIMSQCGVVLLHSGSLEKYD
jgi:hypothetical protein